jgi:hypothetical protein
MSITKNVLIKIKDSDEFDIENWLCKSDFGTFGHFEAISIDKMQ